ncbi:MAG TPA: TolC family protein [Candidatus Acidoferrales bacterium]|nr:TolC family protein [Candidatus Acidoferrales bacterium]
MRSNRWLASIVSVAMILSPLAAGAQDAAPAQETQKPAATPGVPAQPPAAGQSAAEFRMHLYDENYTNGQREFPNIFRLYSPMRIPREVQENAPSLDQLIKDGKLVLSLQDAIELALKNNLDISVQRWVTYQADAGVLSAKAGPGFVSQTGQFLSFDPVFNSTIQWYRSSTPINNPFTSGAGTAGLLALNTQQFVGNVSYGQAFPTGTSFSVALDNSRTSQSPTANFFNPSINSQMSLSFSQNLLNGFGYSFNLQALRVARINRKESELQFEQQLITTTVAVMNQYYELVFAQQDVGVKEKTLQLDEKLYNDNKRQVEIGTLAPLEITRAESEVASAKGALITSQTLALQQETLLKQLIFRNVMDPRVAEISIIPTDKPNENLVVPEIPLATAVGEATANRPDVKQAALDLDARKIVVRGTRNLLLPTLTLSGQYITQGLGGNSIVTAAGPGSFLPTGNPIVDANGVPITTGGLMEFASVPTPGASTLLRGGLHDSLAEVFQSNFPTYGVSLNLSLPLRNRVAQAANINAQLQQKQSAANLQRIRNTVAVDVRNAQIALAQDKAAVDADIRARILAEQTLDAEQKKFLLGASTTFLVIQAERDLANARSTEVRALANLAEAKVNFDRALGRTLAVNRIDVADAAHPDVRVPLIPGTPTSELSSGTRTGDY